MFKKKEEIFIYFAIECFRHQPMNKRAAMQPNQVFNVAITQEVQNTFPS